MNAPPDIAVSIVSHGHAAQVRALLAQLAQLHEPRLRRVVVTLNLPEPDLAADLRHGAWPFALDLIENSAPAGFGANHNRAFEHAQRGASCALFGVLNPDLRLHGNPFAAMVGLFEREPRVGAVYPRQVDAQGRRQDSERLLPTPARLLARHLLRRPLEVDAEGAPDWVNAAFLLLRSQAYAAIGGFDEGFYMYGEDVDLCLRLQLAGWSLRRAGDARVEHAAQRASRRQWRHLGWHLRSLWRLWRSPVWQAWRAGRHN